MDHLAPRRPPPASRAELTPDELKIALTAQQTSLTEGLRGLQADHLKLKQKTDLARSLDWPSRPTF